MIKIKRDQISGILLVGLGIIVFVLIQQFSVPFLKSYPGPKMLPGIAAFGFIVCGAGIFLESTFRKKEEPVFLVRDGWIRLLLCLGLFCIYVLSMKYIGYLIATPTVTYIVVTMFAKERKTKALNRVVFSICLSMIVYLLYVHLFGLPLPSGSLFS